MFWLCSRNFSTRQLVTISQFLIKALADAAFELCWLPSYCLVGDCGVKGVTMCRRIGLWVSGWLLRIEVAQPEILTIYFVNFFPYWPASAFKFDYGFEVHGALRLIDLKWVRFGLHLWLQLVVLIMLARILGGGRKRLLFVFYPFLFFEWQRRL